MLPPVGVKSALEADPQRSVRDVEKEVENQVLQAQRTNSVATKSNDRRDSVDPE
jgi:hypothetical protein